MNIKKKLLVFLFLFLSSLMKNSSFSQNILKGKVLNSDGTACQFVNCFLYNDSLIVDSKISDSLGIFEFDKLKKDKYQILLRYLEVEKIQYIDLVSDTLMLFKLPSVKKLETIIINNKRKLIEKKIDRIVYNVENSVLSSGSNALEAVSKSPGVKVNQSTINIIGKSSVTVYINERLVNLSGDDLMSYLKSISSESVSKIEIITNPSSKYVAQGNNGVINIVLKKEKKQGTNASFNSSFQQNTFSALSEGALLNINKKRISFSSRISNNENKYVWSQNNSISGQKIEYLSTGRDSMFNKSFLGDLSLDFQIDSNTTIGSSVQSNFGNLLASGKNRIDFYNDEKVDSLSETISKTTQNRKFVNYNVYLNKRLDTLGKTFMISFDLLNLNVDRGKNIFTQNLDLINSIPFDGINFQNNGNLNSKAYSLNLDFVLPFTSKTITCGTKTSSINNLMGNQFSSISNNSSQMNRFNYNEFNQALYLDFTREFDSTKFIYKVGLRGEFSNIQGSSISIDSSINYTYFKMFPTLFLQKTYNEFHTLSLNYGKRINRPTYYDLNPFRNYINRYFYFNGNPFVKPSYIHNLELAYSFKDEFILTLSYSRIMNGFSDVLYLNSALNNQVQTPLNHFSSNNISVNLNYLFNKFSWLESNNQLVGYYNSTESNLSYLSRFTNGLGGYFETDNQFVLNKLRTMMIGANFSYSFPSTEGISRVGNYYSLNLGFRYLMLKKKLKFAVNFGDVFRTDIPPTTLNSNSLTQLKKDYYDNRNLRISIVYNIGNNKKNRPKNEVKNLEERERAK